MGSRDILSLEFPGTYSASGQYGIEFVALALQCVNTTDSVDFNATLPTLSNEVTETVDIDYWEHVTSWNSTHEWDIDGLNIGITFKQGMFNESWYFLPSQAFRCTAYNATYRVTVLYSAAADTSTLN